MNEVKTSTRALLLAFFAGMIALSIAIMIAPVKTAYADDVEAQVVTSWQIGSPTPSDVVATLYDDGTLVFSGSGDTKDYTNMSKPAWYENYRHNIKHVIFEEGVTPDNLTYYFYQCMYLQSVNCIPDTVTNMTYTFAGDRNLDTKENEYLYDLKEIPPLPSGLTNVNSTFLNCRGLEVAPVLPDGITAMSSTFMNCTSLVTAPNLPANLKSMSNAFNGCHNLSNVPEIPEGVTSMGGSFSGCFSLKSPTNIPSGVINLNNTFFNCAGMTVIPEGWTIPDDLTRTHNMFSILEGAEYGKDNKLKTYCDPSDYERLSTDSRLTWDAWNRELISGYPDASNN